MNNPLKPKLELVPHPKAPLFAREDRMEIFQQILREVTSENPQLSNKEVLEVIRQAGYVNLWFFLKGIASFGGPFELLNEDLHMAMANYRQTLLYPGCRGAMFIPRSCFKCRAKGEEVLSVNGVVKVENIKVGDKLLTTDRYGKPKITIVKAIGREKSRIYKVKLQSGHIMRVGKGHKFKTPKGFVIPVEDLKEGDLIGVASKAGFKVKPYKDLDWLMGFIYGDGGVTGGSIRLTIVDESLLAKAKRVWKNGLSKRGRYGWDLLKGKEWFLKSGGIIEKAIHKRIPPEYEGSSGFLQGLFDADGSVSKTGRISFCTASKGLANDVQRNLLYFGVHTRITETSTYSDHGKAFYVTIETEKGTKAFQEFIGFSCKSKKERLEKRKPIINRSYDIIPSEWVRLLKGEVKSQAWRKDKKPRLDNYYNLTKDKFNNLKSLLKEHRNIELMKAIEKRDFIWERVVSIKEEGDGEIYPIFVDGNHTYMDAHGVIDHNSTIVTEGATAWELLRDPDLRIRITGSTSDKAFGFVQTIKAIFDSNSLFGLLYPEYVPEPNADRWTKTEIVLPNRRKARREASVEYGGVGGASEGHHYDLHIVDDMIGLGSLNANRESSAEMIRTRNWFWGSEKTLLQSIRKSRVIVVGTRYAVDDVYDDIIGQAREVIGAEMPDFEPNPKGRWTIYYRKAIENGKSIFPESFSIEDLEEMADNDYWTYVTQYLNDPQASGLAEFNEYEAKKCFLEAETVDVPGGESALLWNIRYYGTDGEKVISLANCDVVMAIDPAASEKSLSAKTSRSAVGVLATAPDGKRFLISLNVGFVKVTKVFDWMFAAMRKFKGYLRGTFLEAQGPFKILGPLLQAEQQRRKQTLNLRPTVAVGEKTARIRTTLQPELERGNFYVEESIWPEFWEEQRAFPQSQRKDVLDMVTIALKAAVRPLSQEEERRKKSAERKRRAAIRGITGY